MSFLGAIPEHHPAAKLAEQRWTELDTERAPHREMWGDIARLLRPERGGFGLDDPTTREQEKPLSSAPIMAQMNFTAGLYGALANPANRWFSFQTNNDDLNLWKPARVWLDTVTSRVLSSFASPTGSFYPAAHQGFADMASFGNGAHYDELIREERRIADVTLSLSEVVWDIDAFGQVNEVVRRFRLKPAAAARMFKDDALPAKVIDMAREGKQDKIVFFQHVLPNDGYFPGRLGPKGKKWVSRYCCEIDHTLVRERGFSRMPFYAARWAVDTGQQYGVGPGFIALASARSHMRMDEATLRRAQREGDPTLLAPDRGDWALSGRARPGSVIYNGTNMQGNPMVRALELGGAFSLTLQEKQQKLDEIREAFHYSLMSLAGRTGMTATEVMTIDEERQRLWAPHQGRVQEEFQQPKVDARFQMLWEAGQLPPPPEGMEGASLVVKYTSAAAAAQRSVEGNAVLRVIQDIAPLIQLKPRLGDRLDEDALIEVLADARGAPARVLRSREEADALAQQRQQMQQAAMAMQAAQTGAGVVRDLAGAQAQMAGAEAGAPA